MGPALLLLAVFASAPHRAVDDWVEVRSPHFIVATNAGERQARTILDRFEMFRAAFSRGFPNFRVDPGVPVVIIAAKDDATLEQLLPDEYSTKGSKRPTGMYVSGLDKHSVIIRLSGAGNDTPYQLLYHEYTHVLNNLNFSRLPVWLNEGLAEYFGYSSFVGNTVTSGQVAPGHVRTLRTRGSIPIEQLLTTGYGSPTYNEADRASVFYAQSWALVHYLMLNPIAREQQLLSRFLASWERSGDQVLAARATFGDLERFGRTLRAYTDQGRFSQGVLKADVAMSENLHTVRPLSPGEVLALRADFFGRRGRFSRAMPLLDQALALEPTLPFVREVRGVLAYQRGNAIVAESEIAAAIQLGSTSFATHYYRGLLSLQNHGPSPGAVPLQEALESLEKAIQLNPDFAPAYDALASVYERMPGKQDEAVRAGYQATRLAPSSLPFATHFATVLLQAGRESDAQVMVDRAERIASTPEEKAMVAAVRARLTGR